MGSPADKQRLLGLLYEARTAPSSEKDEAYQRFQAAVEAVIRGTPYSYQQVKLLLLNDGYAEYARHRQAAERNAL